MQFYLRSITCLLFIYAMTGSATARQNSSSSWVLDEGEHAYPYVTKVPLIETVKLRAGYFRESTDPDVQFKGCVLYLEGFGDSMLNHVPYFNVLSKAGYRVISFDYMGQGGSQGSMNNTRIVDKLLPSLQISRIAEGIWQQYAMTQDPVTKHDCSQSKKIVIGWSMGGLAAYDLAYRGWADAVILISPSIHPKTFIGEAAEHPEMFALGRSIVSERTLTRNRFIDNDNPHIDPVTPSNPIKAPLFSVNLLVAANLSHQWVISRSTKGLLLIGGAEDTYVDNKSNMETILLNAEHFKIVKFDGALHELDNEMPAVAEQVQKQTLEFLAMIEKK